MNRLFSAALLSCAAAFLSNPAWSFQGFDFFQQIEQSIECVRKPGTDMLVCSNKFVPVDNEEDEETAPEPVVEPTPEPEGNQWFSEPVDIVIPEFYWPLISEKIDGPHIEFVDAMDFDRDGLMDLVLFTDVNRGRFLGGEDPGPLYRGNGEETFDDTEGASWASEVFVRQTEPGVYEIWNYELFGEDFVNPGGLSRKRILGDFNGDGYTDLVRTQAREDGRRQTQLSGIRGTDTEDLPYRDNWMSQQKAYMSNGDGTYRMEDLGDLVMWAHAITSAKNENGDLDIVFPSYDNETNHNPWTGPANAFTYQGDYQQEYGDYPELGGWDIMASDPVDVGDKNYSKYIADTVEFRENDETYSQGYRVFEQVNGKFELLTEFELSTVVDTIDVHFSDRNTPEGTENIRAKVVWDHQGTRLVNHNWSDSCSLMLNENDAIFVSVADGTVIPEDWDYSQAIYPDEMERGYNKFVTAWKIEDGKAVILDHIFNESPEVPQLGRFFECVDVNGDGLEDYMAWSTGDLMDPEAEVLEGDNFPRVYLNNGQGDLVHTPIKGKDEIEFIDHFVHHKFGTGIVSELKDVNGDGIGDFIHYQYGRDTLRIQYGLKPQR